MKITKHSLIYHHDSALLFERVADQPWAMLLDSGCAIDAATGNPGSSYGRYDIIVAQPIATLVAQNEQTVITENGQISSSEDDPFLVLKRVLSQYQAPSTNLPFAGGAMGYFSYDLGHRLEKLGHGKVLENQPEMMVGIYDWADC